MDPTVQDHRLKRTMGRQANAWRYGGRGGGKFGGRKNGREKLSNKTKEKEMKFATQEQMSKGFYGTYNSIKDLIINDVQKKYEYGCDIATAIRTGTRFDLKTVEPKREESKKTDKDEKQHEQSGMDIKFQEELRVHLDCKKYLHENEIKAYSLIISN